MVKWQLHGAYRAWDHEPAETEIEAAKKEVAIELAEAIMQGRYIMHLPMNDGWYTVGAIIQIREDESPSERLNDIDRLRIQRTFEQLAQSGDPIDHMPTRFAIFPWEVTIISALREIVKIKASGGVKMQSLDKLERVLGELLEAVQECG